MANMTFKTNLLPNSDYGYSLGSIENPANPLRWKIYGDLQPKQTKTFTNVIGTENNWANATFFFGSVRPTAFTDQWTITYKVTAVAAGDARAKAFSIFTLNGHADTYSSYAAWNAIYNTSYRPCYYHIYYRLKEAGFNNNYGHAMGIRLYSSWNATTAANARTITIDILETKNCTFTFFDSMTKYASIPGTGDTNYTGYSEFNFADNGLIETGDSDTTGRDYSHAAYMTNGSTLRLAPNMIFGLDRENHAQGISLYQADYNSSTTSINTARVYNTAGFDWTKGLYYSNSGTNYAINADLNFNPAILYYATDFRYTDNCIASETANNLGMVPRKAVYFRGVIKEDGLFYLAPIEVTYNNTTYKRAWTQDIPTSVETDGTYQYVYWFIGFPYYNGNYAASLYQINKHQENKLYWFNNDRFEEYAPGGVSGIIPIEHGGTGASTASGARNNLELGNAKVFYGTCAEAGATKTAICPEFTQDDLVSGVVILVTMAAKNTGAVGSLTLNVNGTGPKPIKYMYNDTASNIPSAGYIIANQTYMMHYDGTNWVIDNLHYNTNTNDTACMYIRLGNGTYKPSTALYRYMICFSNQDGETVIPTNTTSNSTATTKTLTTESFDIFKPIYYYNTTGTVNAGTAIGVSYLWAAHSNLDLRYSFNTGSTLTANKDVYIVAQLDTPTTAKLATAVAPITQTLPNSDDGYIYIKLGHASNTTNIALTYDHPIYWYRDSKLQPYIPSRGIKTISRSGTTFTVTRDDSSTFTFTQQDNNNAVTQTNQTGNNDYRILLSGTADDTTATEGANKSTNLRFNPSTKLLSVGGSISATGDLDLTGDANLNGETYADSITVGSLLVNSAANFVQIPTAPTPAAGTNNTQLATTEFVTSAVTGLAGPMRFIGSLGTGGTDTSLAAASDSNKGYAYKVITAGTYQSIAAKVGDMLISNGSSWILIPSGDEPSGTVTSITPGNGLLNGTGTTAITTSGTLNINYGTSTAKIGTAAAGTATTVSRSDHVHAIDLDTGDNNGQVKIAGTNVSVKGLGSNAYSSTSYLPLAGGTMTGAINRYYSAASTDPMIRLNSNNQDAILWYIGHGTSATATPSSSYRLLYKGTGSDPNNYLQLISTTGSTDTIAMQMNQAGNITLNGTVTLAKTTDLSGTANNSPALIVGGLATSTHLELDANEIQAKTNGTSTAALYLNNDGGNVYINNNLAGRFTATPTSGQVVVTDGTTGGVKTTGYTIAKSVPSDAVFTDTHVTAVGNHYTPTANANSELTASLSGTAGTFATNTEYTVLTGVKAQRDAAGHITGLTYTAQKIKDTTVANTDTLVKQTIKTDNINYKLLATASASPTSATAMEATYSANVFANPSTGSVSAVRHTLNVSGTDKAYMAFNTTTNAIDFIFI